MIVLEDVKKRHFTTVAFSHDGTWIAAGGDAHPSVIWETTSGREVRRLNFYIKLPTQSIVFHPNAPHLYAATSEGLYTCDLASGENYTLGSRSNPKCVAIDPQGYQVVAGWDGGLELFLASTKVSDPQRSETNWERRAVESLRAWVRAVGFVLGGEQFVSAESPYYPPQSPRLIVRAAHNGMTLDSITGPGTDCEQVAPSPNGRFLATRSKVMIFVFDCVNFAAEPRRLQNDNWKRFTGLAFHPSGKYLAATSNDETVKLYDTTSWQVAKTFTWDIGKMRSVAFSPDGTLAAAGSDTGKVVVWDVDV